MSRLDNVTSIAEITGNISCQNKSAETPAKTPVLGGPDMRPPRKPKPITVVNAYVNATSIEYMPDGGQRYVVSLSDFKNRTLLPQIRIRPGMRLKLVLEADQPGGSDAKK